MRDLISLLLTVVGCVIFIQLLPALLWLFLIVMGIIFVYTIYQRYKFTQYQKTAQKTYYEDDGVKTEIKPDVIDVEFSESEEDIS